MTRVFRTLFTRNNRVANLTIVLLLTFGLGAAALLSAALDRFLLRPLDVPPILNGRAFTDTNADTDSPAPAVINEAFARTFFPSQNPIGKTFGNGAPGETAKADNRLIGIVGDSKYRSLREPLLPIFLLTHAVAHL
jgi:hypothetical protein